MSEIDHLALDGRAIRTFLTVLQEQSVSRAASRLGVTQSAVSHTLSKLRIALDDPLFVRMGRGIAPTMRARSLRQPMQDVLDRMKSMADGRAFDATRETIHFTIAANDHQRRLLFADLFRKSRNEGIDLRMNFITSGVPSVGLLNEAFCQLVVTPIPPDSPDILQTRLFEDTVECFYDPRFRSAPASWADMASADRVDVRFNDGRSSLAVLPAHRVENFAPPVCTVSNFVGLSEFVLGTDTITIQARMLARTFLQHLDHAPLPFTSRAFGMYMAWHRRDDSDPAHRWLRDRVRRIIEDESIGGDL